MINLIGHILDKAEFNEEDQTLSLTIDNDKVFLLKVEGDCCSTGKFITAGEADWRTELPQKIVDVQERGESFSTEDVTYRVYETRLQLENGQSFNIIYDNTSNGYYGSDLDTYYKGEQIYGFPSDEARKDELV